MKRKKLLTAIVALTMGATTALAFSACGGNDEEKPEHTHSYGEWQITAPTREDEGSAVKVCAGDASHKITETLPNLDDGNYAVALGENGYTFTYATASNGNISFDYSPFGATASAEDFAEFEFDGDTIYKAELTFTAVAADSFSAVFGDVSNLMVFKSADDFNNYMDQDNENWYDYPPVLDYNSYAMPVTTAEFEFVAGTEYTFVLAASDKVDVTLYFEDVPTVHDIAVLGENTVELERYESAYYTFAGEPDTEYTIELDKESAAVYKLDWTSNFEFDYSDDDSFTTDSDGKLAFVVGAYTAGEYTFEIAKYVPDTPTPSVKVPVTGIEVKDEDDNDVTEYTLYVNEDDGGVLLGYVKLLPDNATNDYVDYEIEDEDIATVSLPSNANGGVAYLRGISTGTTKLTVTSRDNDEVKAEITLNVEIRYTDLEAGDNTLNLENQPKAYRFTGDANAKYYITFTEDWSYSWTITDASNAKNYIDRRYPKVTYLEVTTDKDGKADLWISGNGAGTLIVHDKDFVKPATEKAPYQSEGVWFIFTDGVYGVSVESENDEYAAYFVFKGEVNTEYKFTVTAANDVLEMGQIGSDGKYIGDPVSTKTFKITTDDDGFANVKVEFSEAVEDLSVELAVAGPYEEDARGRLILNEGPNEGLAATTDGFVYFSFTGEISKQYSVQLSQMVDYVGQCDASNDWIGKNKTDATSFKINTDENGVAYFKIWSMMTNINDLTITITYVGDITGDEDPEPTEEEVLETYEFTSDDLEKIDDYNYYTEIEFTLDEDCTVAIKVEGYYDAIYESKEAYLSEVAMPMDWTVANQLSAGTYKLFVLIGFLPDDNYEITVTKPGNVSGDDEEVVLETFEVASDKLESFYDISYYAVIEFTLEEDCSVMFNVNTDWIGVYNSVDDYDYDNALYSANFPNPVDLVGGTYTWYVFFTTVDDYTVKVIKTEAGSGDDWGDNGDDGVDTDAVLASAVDISSSIGAYEYTVDYDDESYNTSEGAYFKAFTFTVSEAGTYTVTVTSPEPEGPMDYSQADGVYTSENFVGFYVSWDFTCSPLINAYSEFPTADVELEADTEYTYVVVIERPGNHTISIEKKAE